MRRYLSIEPDPFPALPAPRAAPGRTSVWMAARTDRGLERQNNEDRAAFADLASGHHLEPPAGAAVTVPSSSPLVALVCDGMGGEEGGEVASRLAVETIVPTLRDLLSASGARTSADDPAARRRHVVRGLVASIEAASARIKLEAQRTPRLARMGTTATVAALVDRTVLCAQVGDSRAYLLRRGELAQLTRDQTMVELLRQTGTPIEDLHGIVGAHVILQAVGSSARLDVAITETPLEDGDVVLVCSDGLSGPVPDAVLRDTLAAHEDPERACDALIERALDAGGPDNVTCVVLRAALDEG